MRGQCQELKNKACSIFLLANIKILCQVGLLFSLYRIKIWRHPFGFFFIDSNVNSRLFPSAFESQLVCTICTIHSPFPPFLWDGFDYVDYKTDRALNTKSEDFILSQRWWIYLHFHMYIKNEIYRNTYDPDTEGKWNLSPNL
jgi:hypothetical protein